MNNERITQFDRITRTARGTETILRDDGKRFSASEYIYHSAKFTERQENFYQNLLRLYRLTSSKDLPVFFSDGKGNKWRMDKGCVSMAVHDGFLEKLTNNSEGLVSSVTLSWARNNK